MSPLRILLVTIIAVLMVHETETIKCWMCHSFAPGEAGCSDPFFGSADVADDHAFIKECGKAGQFFQLLPNGTSERTQDVNPGLELFCLKLTGKILGTKLVMRGCASGLPNITKGSCMDTEPQRITQGIPLTCDACAGDLCNGAASVGAAAVLVALLLLFLASIGIKLTDLS